jgi:threonine 3-dehydrogenase
MVVTDPNEYRLNLAKAMGATLAITPKEKSLQVAMRERGMNEGFDVGLEMSGSPAAFRSMLDAMCHGGKIAIDWNIVVFNMLNIQGIYGREMYET